MGACQAVVWGKHSQRGLDYLSFCNPDFLPQLWGILPGGGCYLLSPITFRVAKIWTLSSQIFRRYGSFEGGIVCKRFLFKLENRLGDLGLLFLLEIFCDARSIQ